jgi:hypothetical protein
MEAIDSFMTDPSKKDIHDNGGQSTENLFKIIDGIIHQLNNTKKMFIIMIITIMVIPPLSFAITFALFGPPFPFHGRELPNGSGPEPSPFFRLARFIPILISLIWLGIGIRQWFVLSKWTKKYERYRELQKKVDEKLDYNNDDEGKEG